MSRPYFFDKVVGHTQKIGLQRRQEVLCSDEAKLVLKYLLAVLHLVTHLFFHEYIAIVLPGQVGIVDLDICGPSVPKLMAVEGGRVVNSQYGWIPLKYVHACYGEL